NHHPRLRPARTPPPMHWRPPLALRADPGCAQHAAHRRPRQHQSFHLGQLLGEVLVVETRVLIQPQFHHSGPYLLPHPIHRRAPRVAVLHPAVPQFSNPFPHSAHLPRRYPQHRRRLPVAQQPRLHPPHSVQPFPLSLAHLVHPPFFPRRADIIADPLSGHNR